MRTTPRALRLAPFAGWRAGAEPHAADAERGPRAPASTADPAGARAEAGQASVELLALLPALGVAITLAWQALIAGETWWLATVAAREAARAAALGADPSHAATAALPAPFSDGARTRIAADGTATVRLPIPLLLSGGGLHLGSATGHARMEPQR